MLRFQSPKLSTEAQTRSMRGVSPDQRTIMYYALPVGVPESLLSGVSPEVLVLAAP